MKSELDVRDLSSWVADVDYLAGVTNSTILKITTKSGDVYDVLDVPPEMANKVGQAVKNVETVQGTEDEPELSVGQVINVVFGNYEVVKRS
jgi:hypothetical protein